jgi:hypothetical protein
MHSQPSSSGTNIHRQHQFNPSSHQKSQVNGINVSSQPAPPPPPPSSSSSTAASNPYNGFFNQMTSYPPPPIQAMYSQAYQSYTQPPLPPGPPPS